MNRTTQHASRVPGVTPFFPRILAILAGDLPFM
jgi:hypothetical protein